MDWIFQKDNTQNTTKIKQKRKQSKKKHLVVSAPIEIITNESEEECEFETNSEVTEKYMSDDSEWEVSDFCSSNDSGSDYEWIPQTFILLNV